MLVIVLFVLSISNTLAGKCTLRFEDDRPGIFWTTFGAMHTLLSITDDRVVWDDRIEITGYCPGSFTRSDEFPLDSSSLLFSCSGKTIRYRESEMDGSTFSELPNGEISCLRTAVFYETTIPMCKSDGHAYAFFIEDTPIVLAAVCFNIGSRFVHYVAGPQNSVVELREDQKSENLTSDAQQVFISCGNVEVNYEIVAEVIGKPFPVYRHIVQFEKDDLVSFRGSRNFPPAYFDDFKCFNEVIWWKSLKYGNWKVVEEIVRNLARHGTYDVYTGTSGAMTPPADGTFDVNNSSGGIPLYVWKYIKGRNNNTEYEVVIVGINSPFVPHFDRSNNICSDMCEQLSWMSQLQETRKFGALGYVFCCRPNEVDGKLENLPSLELQYN